MSERLNYAGVPDVGDIPGISYDGDVTAANRSPCGEPWLKCCDECAMIDKRQIGPIEAVAAERGAAFYCVHREDEAGRYRVCAGFAARAVGWHRRDKARRAAEAVP